MASQEERLIVLGRLASVLAHEIRNPLAGISAATQVLGGKLDVDDPKHKYVRMILKEIDRVDGIVRTLLDYSNHGRACMMRADVRTVLDTVYGHYGERLSQLGIQLETVYASDLPYPICDREMMARVFSHLISNAVDAMPDGGVLTVRLEHDEAAAQMQVCVEDTGHGVDLDNLGELFSPFYTTKTKGSGLGLAVALKCVEEHGGTITAERREPCGLSMTVAWPVNPPAALRSAS